MFRYLAQGRPVRLPLPEIQIFGGGAHAGRRIDIQDLMVMALAAKSFDEALQMTARVYRAAGELMRDAGKLHGVADEGGWWPEFASNEEAIETLVRAIARAGFVPGDEVAISLDIAASEFGSGGRYRLGPGRQKPGQRRHVRAGARMARALSDRLGRGPARRGRPRRHDALHRRGRRAGCRSSATII